MSFEQSRIHCQRFVVLVKRTLWIKNTEYKHFPARVNDPLAPFMVQLRDGEHIPRQRIRKSKI